HAAHEPILNVSERGDRAHIGIHPDRDLEHPWAGNVVDLCPVGSLLSKDFLHKARAWELDKTPSVCIGCSQGCNVNLDGRAHAIVRVRPRPNTDVNQYFMCDHGRLTYRQFNVGDRIEAPLVADGGELVAVDWDHALARGAQIVKEATGKAVILASPAASNEALHLSMQLVKGLDAQGAFRVDRVEEDVPLPGVANLALRRERAPNVEGATLLGFVEAFDAAVAAAADASLLLVVGEDLEGVPADAISRAGSVIYLGTTLPERARGSHVVLPIASVAEEDGTFVNRDGRVQRYLQAKPAPGMARPAWWVLGELAAELEGAEPLASADEAFDGVARDVPAFHGLSYQRLGLRGVTVQTATAEVR
ncbi:MAG: molybdopterin-dependent oxidoreductase, partial [Gemmatimonadales bacterium]